MEQPPRLHVVDDNDDDDATANIALIEAFTEADRVWETTRQQWNALPNPDARAASGLPMQEASDKLKAAAKALIADAAGRHHIEQQAVVYLELAEDGTWDVDRTTYSGPLEGYEGGPINDGCEEHEDDDDLQAECDALKQAAGWMDLPTAEELRAKL